ncbi:hypothetical protein A9Q96_09980 [Rhodobacterales bacterium 52_120_T64]|nr:hypothetical protein A9Q96_09980 [Rhodobacterales bacterium 52_120_T64]
MTKIIKNTTLILTISAGLAGCSVGSSNTEGDFLCEAQIGSPCTTISGVDGSGAAAIVALAEQVQDTLAGEMSQDPLPTGKGGIGSSTASAMNGGTAGYNPTRYRQPEILGTLWIAPYLDDESILHEATNVHFVVQEAHWSGRS